MPQGASEQGPHKAAAAAIGVKAQRVIFIDLARSLAVMLMLYGHTASALLAPEFRAGTWYEVWQFQRGLTSCLFLLLSGFAFSVATSRRWSSHVRLSWAVFVRIRRFLLFVVLGYALHFQVPRLADLLHLDEAQWRAFLAVDVLQLIGTTFVFVQLLVVITRTRQAFTVIALALSAAIVLATPAVWGRDWTALPLVMSSYFSEASGSLFPWFPWSAYILLGVALGQLYGRWGAAHLAGYATRALILPGTLMTVTGAALQQVASGVFGDGPGHFVPYQFLVRAGVCLLILGGIAHASRGISRLPRVFGAVAQETLLIYFVHLCIVFGSIWSPGLSHFVGATLTPLKTLAVVMALIAAMVLLAWQWNGLKHASPRAARWISIATGIGLVLWLI